MNKKQDGIAIAIAWPEFMGKQAGSWYDPIMQFLGFNKNFHYQVGHASLVLINAKGKCHYFDCGRYEAPYQKGRIRDCSTDCGLEIKTMAEVTNEKLSNFKEILLEIQTKKACKGFGILKAAYCTVNFKQAYSKVKDHQDKGIMNFGPFIVPGTNCCRFVQEGIANGHPSLFNWLKLRFLFPLWPKPMTIIALLPNKMTIPDKKLLEENPFQLFDTTNYYRKANVKDVIQMPSIPPPVPKGSKWLAGEMAGSWFHIKPNGKNIYEIDRYDEEGESKCSGNYAIKGDRRFDPIRKYEMLYPSHCNKVMVEQDKRELILERVN